MCNPLLRGANEVQTRFMRFGSLQSVRSLLPAVSRVIGLSSPTGYLVSLRGLLADCADASIFIKITSFGTIYHLLITHESVFLSIFLCQCGEATSFHHFLSQL